MGRPARTRQWWIVAAVALLTAFAVGVVWIAQAVLWFGPEPPAVDYQASWSELAAEANGLANSAGENAWGLVEEASRAASAIEAEFGRGRPIDYDEAIADPESVGARALAALEARGVFELLDRLAADPRGVRPASPSPMLEQDFGLSAAREIARAQTARFVAAYRAGDEQTAAAAFRQTLALGRIVGNQPTIMERLVGIAIVGSACDKARTELTARRPSEATALAMLESLDLAAMSPAQTMLEGERIAALDTIAATLGSSRLKVMSRGAQMAKLNEVFDAMTAAAALPRSPERERAMEEIESVGDGLGRQFIVVGMLVPSIRSAIHTADVSAATVAGTRLMLAIEAYAARHGAPPEALSELTPEVLPELPGDPFNAAGFVYRRVDPAQDPLGRDYLLYSTGLDGKDDGGKTHPKGAHVAFQKAGAGFDDVFNIPPEPAAGAAEPGSGG